MKRLNKFLLIGAVTLGLGLSACSNEDAPDPGKQDNGGHYLGISLTFSSPPTRAIVDDSDPGLPEEGKLSAASAVVVAFPTGTAVAPVVSEVQPLNSLYTDSHPAYNPKEEAAIGVAAGIYDVYVVVGPSGFISAFKTAVTATPGIIHQKDLFAQLNTLADIQGLTAENAFVMSSREAVQVTAQATKETAVANPAEVKLDRLVAKVTVTATGLTTTPTTFTSALAGFTLEQGKTAQYTMMQDKAVPSTGFPTGVTPLANDWNPSTPAMAVTNFAGSWGGSPADNPFGTAPGRASDGGLYTTENTTVYGGEESPNIYKVGTTTYALIRVAVTPSDPIGTKDTEDTNPDNTFYFGLSDYKFYYSRTAATTANGTLDGTTPGTVGNNGYLVYKGGYAYYTVWVGQNYPTANYAPVVRNRWYNLNVANVLQLGTPYDPINWENPKVPYEPGTDGPVTPPVDPDPEEPIVPEVKYIAAELTVMDWTVVSRDIELK